MPDEKHLDWKTVLFAAIMLSIPVIALTIGGAYSAAGFLVLFGWWLSQKRDKFLAPWWVYAGFCAITLYYTLVGTDVLRTPPKAVTLLVLALQVGLALVQARFAGRKAPAPLEEADALEAPAPAILAPDVPDGERVRSRS